MAAITVSGKSCLAVVADNDGAGVTVTWVQVPAWFTGGDHLSACISMVCSALVPVMAALVCRGIQVITGVAETGTTADLMGNGDDATNPSDTKISVVAVAGVTEDMDAASSRSP